jgi:hypothetical protein
MSATPRPQCPGPFQDCVHHLTRTGAPAAMLAQSYGVTVEEIGDALLMVQRADEAAKARESAT